MTKNTAKLDWTRMLGFEQIAGKREAARAGAALGAKIGEKLGGKIGVKAGLKD